MPVLFVPPTQVIPFDAERLVEQRTAMDEFRAQLVALWQAKPQDEIKSGGFRRSRFYQWGEPFEAVLQTFYIYPSGIPQRTDEVAKIAALFKKESCQLLGSVVIWGKEWTKSIPSGELAPEFTKLRQASSRQFNYSKSPVRLSTEGSGYWGTALAWITEAYVGESLTNEGLTVISDLAGVACAKASQTAQSLKRGHRQVRIFLGGTKPNEPERWPQVRGRISIFGLPFNSTIAALKPAELKQERFNPTALASVIRAQVQPTLHDLNVKDIKISKRAGRFVTVERGLASGLKIGMHLVGPDGAKLHVIRFDNTTGAADAAILLIRKESEERPLAEGALLQVDPTQFPLR